MVEARAELVAIRRGRTSVLKIIAGISVAARGARSVGKGNESCIRQNPDGDGVHSAQRDLVIEKGISDESRASGRVGHRSRTAGVEYLPPPVSPTQCIGHSGGSQQVLAEVPVSLRDAGDGGKCGVSAGLPEALICREKKGFSISTMSRYQEHGTAEIEPKLVLMERRRAGGAECDIRIAFVTGEGPPVGVKEATRLHGVVSHKLPSPAVELFGSRFRNHIDLGAAPFTELGGIVVGLDFNFLNCGNICSDSGDKLD